MQAAARAAGDMDLLVFREQVKKKHEVESVFSRGAPRQNARSLAFRAGSKWGRAYLSYLG